MATIAVGIAVLAIGSDGTSPEPPSVAAVPTAGGDWAPLDLLTVIEPESWGALGDGSADDTDALQATFDAVSERGGIVWLGAERSYRTTDVIRIVRDHTKVWAPDGQAEFVADGSGNGGRRALVIDEATGAGIFGLVLRSDADERRTALEDSAVVLDGAFETELVGLEIVRSSSAAIFVYGQSRRTWVEGNELTNNWADGVHFTDGSREAWVWDNVIINEDPTLGDDGIACVTYGSGPRCGHMEWWDNTHLGNGWGRGLAVVGGDNIAIHDNLVSDTAAAGILVASESSYETPGSDGVAIERNVVEGAGHAIPHPGILISALHGSIADVVIADNSVGVANEQPPVRVEGDVSALVERNTSTIETGERLTPGPGAGRERPAKPTSILATRDTSLVPGEKRRGLYRIHVRGDPQTGFEQRLEYIAAGAPSDLETWKAEWGGQAIRFPSSSGDEEIIVIRTGLPIVLPSSFRPIAFEDLRVAADETPELWEYLDGF